jgi:hypothetical protein
MKTFKMNVILVIVLVFAMIIPTVVMAEDVVLNAEIDSVTVALDKNGNEYVRVIISEPRTLNGTEYETTVAVMFFGETVSEAKLLKEGETLNLIANKREYRGSPSYTAIKLL